MKIILLKNKTRMVKNAEIIYFELKATAERQPAYARVLREKYPRRVQPIRANTQPHADVILADIHE